MLNSFTALFIGLITSALTGIIAIWILSYPGGLAGMVGNVIAMISLQTGIKNWNILYPAFGFSQIILLQFFVSFLWITFGFAQGPSLGDQIAMIDDKVDMVYKLLRDDKVDMLTPEELDR
jgi:hypothetical protein